MTAAVIESANELTDNHLVGALSDLTLEENQGYVLKNGIFEPCLAGTLPAGKAYLAIAVPSNNAKNVRIIFGDESNPTAISEVSTQQENTAIYTLGGVRVSKAQKGVYIVNGKKVVK